MPGLTDAPVTFFLLLVNVLVSGYALLVDTSLVERLSFQPHAILKRKEHWRLITAGFVHVGMGHLAFNMITLYFFGPLLEVLLGSLDFTVLYFGSELAAHGLSLIIHHDNESYAAVGASGAVSGVLFGYCLFFPFEKIYFFGVIPMWSIVFAVGYVALSIYAINRRMEGGAVGGIAHEAHLGGALGGLLLTIILEPRAVQVFLNNFGL
ncbi:MAG: rhomboid family intramembrane serine protease [Rhodothermales bacterium]|nr:rhomboid family intramembrane serine protease [Rhodothermales bacterium]